MLDLLLPERLFIPVGFIAVGLSLSEAAETLVLMLGFKLPRRVLRELLPQTSKVSVGVRRNVSKISEKKNANFNVRS